MEEAKERRRALDGYVADLEQQLATGTVWNYDPGAFEQMCKEVKEQAIIHRNEADEREIARQIKRMGIE